ncbi:MAG TPA: hypothetical protein VFU43_29160 [Streptosporangiaceae bacterium]|nr:hypothetical protein [Streptosporangiaceae bacterium]
MNTSMGSPGRDLELGRPAEGAAEAGDAGTDGARTGEPGVELLATAGELVRMSAQDALTAGVYLLVVLVGVLGQLSGLGALGAGTALVRLLVLAGVTACFAVSLTLVIRSRVTLARALGELRRLTGAPYYPFTPWSTRASAERLTSAAFERELRQLMSAAGRCSALAGQATAWAAATGLLFVCWTLIGIRGR